MNNEEIKQYIDTKVKEQLLNYFSMIFLVVLAIVVNIAMLFV